MCSLANYSVAYEETQSNRVFDFRDFVCSLFPKATLFDSYSTLNCRNIHKRNFSLPFCYERDFVQYHKKTLIVYVSESVSRGIQEFLVAMPNLYSGLFPMKIQCKGQTNRSVRQIYT